MFWLKSCPKCDTGDLYGGQDQCGQYIACLQCGHYLTEVEEVVLRYSTRIAGFQPSHAQVRQSDEASVMGKSLVEAVPGIPPGQSNPRAGVA